VCGIGDRRGRVRVLADRHWFRVDESCAEASRARNSGRTRPKIAASRGPNARNRAMRGMGPPSESGDPPSGFLVSMRCEL
jgi:hypothetical protein